MITVRHIPQPDLQWLVLEGRDEQCPQATVRRTIHAGALASGHLTIAAEKAALIAQVERNVAHFRAVEEALRELSA